MFFKLLTDSTTIIISTNMPKTNRLRENLAILKLSVVNVDKNNSYGCEENASDSEGAKNVNRSTENS